MRPVPMISLAMRPAKRMRSFPVEYISLSEHETCVFHQISYCLLLVVWEGDISQTMLIPHLALPVLNATNLLLLNGTSPAEPSANNQVFCLQQLPPSKPQRLPTTYGDCMNLATRIVSGGKPYAQIDFSRDPGLGFETPYRLYGGTCVFEIDINPAHDTERSWAASFYEIGMTAIEILPPCVVDPPHLGGLTKVGRDRVLDMVVYGRPLHISKSSI